MSDKPNFDPRPEHMWVVKVYPGGRMQWEQMHLLSASVVYASASKAARVLGRGYHTHTTDEHVAAEALQLFRAAKVPTKKGQVRDE